MTGGDTSDASTSLGVVVIGRNEGERLKRCLQSILRAKVAASRVAYVDSGSSDGSVSFARSLGVEVIELDLSTPFTAARARNAGVKRLLQREATLQFIQFIDGDCELRDDWLERGIAALQTLPQAAVAAGRLRERSPEASLYNRLADMEWDTPVGETTACGGIFMTRVEPFQAVGGFDETVPAGEEPELCKRLRDVGWKIFRIDAEMAWHDSAMLRFGQWWKRAVRGGYGWMDVTERFGPGPGGEFARQVRSARLWTVAWLVAMLASAIVAAILRSRSLALVPAALALLPAAQALRLAIKARRRMPDFTTSLAYGALTVLSKWANAVGQLRWLRDRSAGRGARLIEHKTAHA